MSSHHPHITDVDGTLHHTNTSSIGGVTSTGVADPLSAFRVSEEEQQQQQHQQALLAASDVVDATVGGVFVGDDDGDGGGAAGGGEDEEALRAGEEAAAAAMEGELMFVSCYVLSLADYCGFAHIL